MNLAIVCDTAYQVLNAVNFVYHLKQETGHTADIYIGHQFHGSRDVACRLQKEGLFDCVYSYLPKKPNGGALQKLKRLVEIAVPAFGVKQMLMDPVPKKAYDTLMMSMATHFSVSMAFLYPKAQIWYYEDGTGSYSGDTGISMMRGGNRMVYRLLGKNLDRIAGEALYLNNPGFATERITLEIRPLPVLAEAPEALRQMLHRIWDIACPDYYVRHKVIYLTEPNDDGQPGYDRIHRLSAQLLKRYAKDGLTRPHPRQLQMEADGLELDTHRDLWELVCAEQIGNGHILMSIYSTAQWIPKILFDKEPSLIFTYRAVPGLIPGDDFSHMDAAVKRLRDSYRNPEKIHVPDSEEALEQCCRQQFSIQ